MLSESESLELKKSTSELKEAIESIAAILNKHGRGELFFGVKNNGETAGQQVSDVTLRKISQAVSAHIEPRIYPTIEECKISGKNCVRVSFHGDAAPYFAFGRAYLRVGDEDRQMSAKELEGLILKKNKEMLRWDNKVCKEASYADVSVSKFRAFLEKASLPFDSVANGLKKLRLAQDGKPLNAAVLLFGAKPQKFFLNAKLRCAVFSGTTAAEIIDRQEYEGDLFYLLEEAQKYVWRNTHLGMRIEGLERVDVPEINREALREAVVNAFCHRDYHLPDSVNVAVFSDRVEVRSPGLLYGGLTIDRIVKENVSERRNELVADMLHRVHLIEKWGRGIRLILSKEPGAVFKEVGRQFITVLPRKPSARLGEKLGEKEEATPKTTPKTTLKSRDAILELIRENPGITKKELAEKTGLTLDGVKYHVRKLAKRGSLFWTGPSKGGHWQVLEKQNEK